MFKRHMQRFCTLTAVLALACTGLAAAQEAPQLLEPAGVMMDTVEAYVGEISRIAVYDAAVVPYVEELFFTVEGEVDEMHVVVGQRVKAGDVLITLNQEAELERMEELQAELEEAHTNGEFEEKLWQVDLKILDAELRALMAQTPHDENAIALKKLEREELQLDMSLERSLRNLQLERLETELEELEEEVQKNMLLAPFDGQIVYVNALQQGSYVGAYTPLLYLADDTRLHVQSPYISGAYLDGCDEMYALVGAERYGLTPAEVDEKEYIAQMLAGETLKSDFSIESPGEELEAGQYAAICLVMQRAEDALIVPSNAVFSDKAGRYLYLIEDGVRVRRDVKVGISTDWETQITEGLEEGDVVYVKD